MMVGLDRNRGQLVMSALDTGLSDHAATAIRRMDSCIHTNMQE